MGLQYKDAKGVEVELPKFDLALARLIDKVAEAEGNEAKWKAQYNFLQKVFDADYLAERLQGDSFKTVDLAVMEAMFHVTVGLYARPSLEAQMQQANSELESVDPLVDRMVKMAEAVTVLNNADRQGFRSVK